MFVRRKKLRGGPSECKLRRRPFSFTAIRMKTLSNYIRCRRLGIDADGSDLFWDVFSVRGLSLIFWDFFFPQNATRRKWSVLKDNQGVTQAHGHYCCGTSPHWRRDSAGLACYFFSCSTCRCCCCALSDFVCRGHLLDFFKSATCLLSLSPLTALVGTSRVPPARTNFLPT